MSTLTSKKQTKVLYGTLIVLLAAVAVLMMFTGNANRRDEADEKEKETRQSETLKEDTGLFGSKETAETPEETQKTSAETGKADKSAESETEKTSQTKEEETAAVSSTAVLPVFHAPVEGIVHRGYSMEVPVFSYTMNDYRTHDGVDIACTEGTPVFAAADGVIHRIWNDPFMGVSVSIRHDGDAVTTYQGLAETLPAGIAEGTGVKAGQMIAGAGNTALLECAEETHVHLSMTVGGESVDPAEYMHLTFADTTYED
ncbi:MAG: M23 family metallopeptidase [Clostridia bacterium]|nr:M23 family metallopeptidase [Clostridia bacterium]